VFSIEDVDMGFEEEDGGFGFGKQDNPCRGRIRRGRMASDEVRE